MIATVVTGSVVVLISGIIFAASTPLTLIPGLWGNLADLAILVVYILLICLRDLLSRRRVIQGIVKLCVVLCWPAILASSEMGWLHDLAEQCYLRFHVSLNPSLLLVLLTMVMAGCILLQAQTRGRDLRRELRLREANEDEVSAVFAWQTGAVPVLMILTGLSMALFLAGQNLAPIRRIAKAASDRLPPGLTVLAGVTLVVLIVGAYLVETE